MARTQLDGFQIENDSVSGDDIIEESLVDSKIPFVDSGFSALNIHDAIIEANSSPDHHAGFSDLGENNSIEVTLGKISINTKFEKQGGFIKHSGFIKGCA